MRKLVVTSIVVAGLVLAGAGTSAGHRAVDRVVPGAVSVRVPAGWHLLHGWLSDVVDPAPRLAVASFPARLSRHTCACGFPNVVNMPRDGAFMFVWEELPPLRPRLARVPPRPARFSLAGPGPGGRGVRHTCDSPTDTLFFKTAGRVFEVEVYLGPQVAPGVRARMAATLDSLRAAAGS